MAKTVTNPMSHLIRRVVADESARQLPDHVLLTRFSEHGDEGAFGTLLQRHGPMVLGVCRSVLGNEADAEDAFQATFLVLARKAGSIRKTAAVGSWLHGVAHRTALKARAKSASVAKTEARAPAPPGSEPDDLTWREVQQALHEELNGLAERYRGPLVACYLQGKTQDEAAAQLGLAKSTLKERMERGRALLRAKLVRRGLGPVAVLAAATWSAPGAASVPPALASSALHAAQLVASGQATTVVISANVAALTEGVLKTMSLTKLKHATLLLLGLVVAAAGAGLVRPFVGAAEPPSTTNPDRKGADKKDADRKGAGKPSTARTLRLPDKPYAYADIDLPAHFKTDAAKRFDNTPADNPVTDHGATLGRVLFYDTRLSANNTVSCGSCHVQKNAFSDPNRFSKGFAGEAGDRHAMSLVNLRYVRRARFFWDERAGNLEQMVLVPIEHKKEMGQDLDKMVEVLGKDDKYGALFKSAFGDDKVTKERVGQALAQFVRSMVSYRSKFDEGAAKASSVRNEFPNFTAQENQGRAVFVRHCAICHMPEGQTAHFSLIAPLNIGLDADTKDRDGGVGAVTKNDKQLGLFRPPSLRNVEVTAPYMHDGRFDTLEKVIDHYSKDVKPHPNLSPRVRKLDLLDAEKAALVAFLKTLTDQKFLADPKFSDPFR